MGGGGQFGMKILLLYYLPEEGKEREKKVGVGVVSGSGLSGEGWTLIRGVRAFVWRSGERRVRN